MNRTILTVAGVFSASSLLLVDSAIKGTALLVLAAVVAIILRRDSAATRHLVWLLAIVAMLAVPALSAMLPQWRVLPGWVLPGWAGISPQPVVVDISPPLIATTSVGAVELPQHAEPLEIEQPSATAYQPAAVLPASRPALAAPQDIPAKVAWSWNWLNTLPLVWGVGFGALMLRLLVARWILWNTERQGTVIGSARQPAKITHDPILAALHAATLQLRMRRPVTLLIHPEKTIPMVWGILRCRLLLPVTARQWTSEQLNSVLLHELAHIKRRDTIAQLLEQIACALHWFNPLVWFAAWRLHVERERACDDLVLASGVRPSAYAGHLLEVVTGLSSGHWTQPCGLAMARQSSLEGRLAAVLGKNLDRRSVSVAIAGIALATAVSIAVPIAMLGAADDRDAKAAAELEKKIAAVLPQALGDATPVKDEPKDAKSKALFESWKSGARTNGMIPGGRIGEMAASLKTYMDLNAGTEAATKCESVFKKCDATRDWTPAEAAALLDEIEVAAPSRAEWAMRTNIERQIHPGKPLPAELKDAPWGSPEAQGQQLDASSVALRGLRFAWLLEPREGTQPLDRVMKSRVLFHNTGKIPVCFATENWIQSGGHTAKDASGKDIKVWAVSRMGLRTRMIFRLAPGEYAEVEGHGAGVGSHETSSEKSIYKVGCWIEAKEGDVVTFTPGKVPVSFQTWQNNEGRKDSATVWREMIAGRIAQESPMPAAVADREQLLRRVTKDLLGTAPTAEEIATFANDNGPDALAKLTARLQIRASAAHFAGELSGGTTKFRVTAAVPKKDQPQQGVKLQPATEEKLEWGEPVNGLRLALAWPPTLGEPAVGEVPDFYLAVQNVSTKPLRLYTMADAPDMRQLTIKTAGVIQSAIVNRDPSGTDLTLQPREVVFVRLFPEQATQRPDLPPHGSLIASGVRQSPAMRVRADMVISKAPGVAWTGKLSTPDTRAGVGSEAPKNRKAQQLFKEWLSHARLNGKIPGGFVARLGERVQEFVRANAADPAGAASAQRMEPLISRLGLLPPPAPQRDWQPTEASALLNDIAAVSDAPLSVMLEEIAAGKIQHGLTWHKELEGAPWGEPVSNGLRTASVIGLGVISKLRYVDWVGNVVTQGVEKAGPAASTAVASLHLGTPLGCRILIHNAGKEPVVFRTRSWHHIEPSAKDVQGMEIGVESVTRFTRAPLMTWRLEPGRYIELSSPGFGLGKYGFHHFRNEDITTWIGAKEGDAVTLLPGPLPLNDWNEPTALDGQPRWWLDFIRARLHLATPLPDDAAERKALLRRAMGDLFIQGTDPTDEEYAAFVGDKSPQALTSVAERLFHRAGVHAWAGPLTSGPTKFRVLAADPDAAKKFGVPKPATEKPR
jgi:beta-lactamase regulating signal transducer with metallopeptidase domain